MPGRPFLLRSVHALLLAALLTVPLSAQEVTSREVVQPLPSQEVQRLNRALMELARRPKDLEALVAAGDAALELDDLDAAMGFYGRADDLDPSNARVKLGIAAVYLRSGRPVEALQAFALAEEAEADPAVFARDRGLAYDLVGDHERARAAYQQSLGIAPDDPETQRRLALSFAIAGNRAGFEDTLRPLLDRRDYAAFRTRAFGLAILGDQSRAAAIVDVVMPRDLATRITPYLAYMPRLTSAQQAAAANLGIFPRVADIGREDPRIARFAREAEADRKLAPTGAPLGARFADRTTGERASPAASSGDEAKQPPAVSSSKRAEGEAAVGPIGDAQPGFSLAFEEAGRAPTSSRAPEAGADPIQGATAPVASVADAFADLGEGDLPVAGRNDVAVDLAAIEIPREAPPAPEPPAHPRRIWVQVATGRDIEALRFDWRRISRKAGDLLSPYEPHTTPWGQANRLLAGPIENADEARDMVNALKAKGLDTFPYTSPEGREIQALD